VAVHPKTMTRIQSLNVATEHNLESEIWLRAKHSNPGPCG